MYLCMYIYIYIYIYIYVCADWPYSGWQIQVSLQHPRSAGLPRGAGLPLGEVLIHTMNIYIYMYFI